MDHLARVLFHSGRSRSWDRGRTGGSVPWPLRCGPPPREKAQSRGRSFPEGLAGPAQGFNLERLFGRDPRPRAVRPAGPALETGQAFVLEAHQPFRNSDGRNADGAGYRTWRFAGRPPVDNPLRCCFGFLTRTADSLRAADRGAESVGPVCGNEFSSCAESSKQNNCAEANVGG
jgi:hypothetical protein